MQRGRKKKKKTGLERNAAATDLLINTGNKQTYMWKEAADVGGKRLFRWDVCGCQVCEITWTKVSPEVTNVGTHIYLSDDLPTAGEAGRHSGQWLLEG